MKSFLLRHLVQAVQICIFLCCVFCNSRSFAQGTGLIKCWADKDGDGYGDPNDLVLVDAAIGCGGLFDVDRRANNDLDCDDNNAAINPNTIWYKDADGDGFTDGTNVPGCTRPDSYYKLGSELRSLTDIDCDDNDRYARPDQKWYSDPDNDGYTNSSSSHIDSVCTKPPGNWLSNTLLYENGSIVDGQWVLEDCNQDDPLEHPNQQWYPDLDGDGYPGSTTPLVQCSRPVGYIAASGLASQLVVDCDDYNWSLNPGIVYVLDKDNDGYYTGSPIAQCGSPGAGYVIESNQPEQEGDCDDNDP
ncbi:MAG: hypothetical protein ACM3H8_02265, partial [Sphingobacteriales bacterium]